MENFWRIKDWNEHFENNRTRDLKRMAWVPMPNKMDGDGYTELLDHPNGAAHFGVWVAIVEIASRCGLSPVDYDAAGGCGKTAGECEGHAGARIRRGTLVRDNGKPHDFNSIFRLSRMPIEILKEVIPRLVSLGWLEEIPLSSLLESDSSQKPQAGAGKPQELANVPHEGEFLTRARGTERNGTERNINTPPTPSNRKVPDEQLQEISDAFDRHLCHHNLQPRDLVIQQVISMNGKFTWDRFRSNHKAYCEYWSQKGWNFCKLTFLGWVNAGMPPAPGSSVNPPIQTTPRGPCGKCGKDPCQCHRAKHAKMMEELDRAKSASAV